MPFTSANLKILYEQALFLGIPISASDAGRLFSNRDLRDLITRAKTQLRRIASLKDQIQRIENQLEQAAPGSKQESSLKLDLVFLYNELDELEKSYAEGGYFK